MNKEIDKLNLWTILHGITIGKLISSENCYQYCQHNPRTCAHNKRKNWAQIIKNKILKVKLTKDHKSDKEYENFINDGEKNWTCIEFVYHQKK